MSQSTQPPDRPRETRLELRLDRAIARATTPRGAVIVIAVASISITFAAGLVMTIVDSQHYPSLGSGLWWAIQTVTTVGYGDNPPSTAASRFVAGLVMLFGIGFLSVTTAAITSAFVSRPRTEGVTNDGSDTPPDQFRRIDRRLDEIEAAVAGISTPLHEGLGNQPATVEQIRQLDLRLERIEEALARRS